MKLIFVFLILLATSGIHAEIYKCSDSDGKVIFSDKPDCKNPDKVNITAKSPVGDITLEEAVRLRSSPHAVKLAFDKKATSTPFGYYEGFYIVYPDHVSVFIDYATISSHDFDDMNANKLEGLQFSLLTVREFGSVRRNYIDSSIHNIEYSLMPGETVILKNIGFTIWTEGYNRKQLSKYKLLGTLHYDAEYHVKTLSRDFLIVPGFDRNTGVTH